MAESNAGPFSLVAEVYVSQASRANWSQRDVSATVVTGTPAETAGLAEAVGADAAGDELATEFGTDWAAVRHWDASEKALANDVDAPAIVETAWMISSCCQLRAGTLVWAWRFPTTDSRSAAVAAAAARAAS